MCTYPTFSASSRYPPKFYFSRLTSWFWWCTSSKQDTFLVVEAGREQGSGQGVGGQLRSSCAYPPG